MRGTVAATNLNKNQVKLNVLLRGYDNTIVTSGSIQTVLRSNAILADFLLLGMTLYCPNLKQMVRNEVVSVTNNLDRYFGTASRLLVKEQEFLRSIAQQNSNTASAVATQINQLEICRYINNITRRNLPQNPWGIMRDFLGPIVA